MSGHSRQRTALTPNPTHPADPAKFIDPTTPLRYAKPMQVSLQYAAEHLAELASAARRGEEVEIA